MSTKNKLFIPYALFFAFLLFHFISCWRGIKTYADNDMSIPNTELFSYVIKIIGFFILIIAGLFLYKVNVTFLAIAVPTMLLAFFRLILDINTLVSISEYGSPTGDIIALFVLNIFILLSSLLSLVIVNKSSDERTATMVEIFALFLVFISLMFKMTQYLTLNSDYVGYIFELLGVIFSCYLLITSVQLNTIIAQKVNPKAETTSETSNKEPIKETPKVGVSTVSTTKEPAKETPKVGVSTVSTTKEPAKEIAKVEISKEPSLMDSVKEKEEQREKEKAKKDSCPPVRNRIYQSKEEINQNTIEGEIVAGSKVVNIVGIVDDKGQHVPEGSVFEVINASASLCDIVNEKTGVRCSFVLKRWLKLHK